MASIAVTAGQGAQKSTSTSPSVPHIKRLWQETKRVEQLARLKALQIQTDPKLGGRAWSEASLLWNNMPEDARAGIVLPGPDMFAWVLGVFRTCATLKKRKMLVLELSAQDIADVIKKSKSTVEAVLRWLACGPIEYKGAQVGRGLGIIHRGRRTAWAFLEGVLRRVYRTSKIVLTFVGRLLLGLTSLEDERKLEQEASAQPRKKSKEPKASTSRPPHPSEHEPAAAGEAAADIEVASSWIQRILASLA